MAKEKVFASPEALVAIGRQRGEGYYNRRSSNLLPLLMTSFQPKLSGAMSSLGIEVGGNTITEQRSQKESFSPSCTLSGHIRVGATLNLLAALGYKPITVGQALAVPVTDTLGAAASRHRRNIVVGTPASFSVGDFVQVGTVSVTPVSTDAAEVHQVTAVNTAAITEVQTITIYGTPTGGTFTLSYGGYTTAALAYNATGAQVQAALEALTSIGTGNVTVTGSGPYVVTFAGTLASKAVGFITGDGDQLTGGTGYGANAGLPGQSDSYVDVQVTTEGAAAGSLTLSTGLLYDYAAAIAVQKVDSNKAYTTYFFHVQPSDALDNDGFSLYVKFSNSEHTFALHYFDGKASRFDLSFQTGQIATFQAELKFADVVVVSDTSTVTVGADPSNVTLNNTRGDFTYLGNHVDAPRSVNLTFQAEIPDDFTLFRYKPQSIVHTGHTLSMSSESKFIKDLSDKINFNVSDATVSDVIPEYPLDFNFLSQKLVGSTNTPYGLEIAATDVQYSEYDPQLNTNQFVQANLGMMKIVPNGSQERWYFKATGKASSDVFAAL